MAMGERHQLLHMAIEVTPNHLQLVVMDTLGRRLATLSSSGDGYQLKRAPGAPKTIDYRRLLAALQITFWPLETLNGELGPAGWQFVQRGERGAWYYGELAARVSSEETAAWTGRYQLFFPRDGFHWNLQSVLLP
jgi:hypothetical protein